MGPAARQVGHVRSCTAKYQLALNVRPQTSHSDRPARLPSVNLQETETDISHPTATSPWHSVITTELGDLTVVRDQCGLRGLYFPHHWYRPAKETFGPRRDEGFEDTARQMSEYLAGQRREFAIPHAMQGDPFQHTVWQLIDQISYGQTVTYGELASQLGGGATAQQVGAAVGRNPLCIIVPCHRVVGSGGKLTGYAGGIARKHFLLNLEQDHASRSAGSPFQDALLPLAP
jgi:methylated-DNA-[protein]-cysteine S-methyltransferase